MGKQTTLINQKPPKARKKEKEVPHNPRATGRAEVEMGHRIRLRRVELNMSQSELAKRLGVSFQQVQKYEKGVNRVQASRLETIANTLQVPVGFFFDGKDKHQNEVESLLFLDSNFSLRLLRAYTSIQNQKVQRTLVNLMEGIAGVTAAAEE